MQGGQMQFKLDQPGLIKAAPVALGAAAVAAVLYVIYGLWGLLQIVGWIVPIFAGVWYIMTVRKGGTLPDQTNGLVNGAILGGAAGLVNGLVSVVTVPIGANSYLASLGLGDFGAGLVGAAVGSVGAGTLLTSLIFGLALGAAGAFGYSYLVKQGTIK